jgi:hypothetical protein
VVIRESKKISATHIKQEEASKYRCKLCSKLFKAPEFLYKHIPAKHPSEFDVLDKVGFGDGRFGCLPLSSPYPADRPMCDRSLLHRPARPFLCSTTLSSTRNDYNRNTTNLRAWTTSSPSTLYIHHPTSTAHRLAKGMAAAAAAVEEEEEEVPAEEAGTADLVVRRWQIGWEGMLVDLLLCFLLDLLVLKIRELGGRGSAIGTWTLFLAVRVMVVCRIDDVAFFCCHVICISVMSFLCFVAKNRSRRS